MERQEYYSVACCPSNIARLLAQLPGFIYAYADDTAYVNLFVGSSADIPLSSGNVRIGQTTNFPWDGRVTIEVDVEEPTEFELRVRIPGWSTGQPVPTDLYAFADEHGASHTVGTAFTAPAPTEIGGHLEDGYYVIRRVWSAGDEIDLDLDMEVRRVAAHEAVAENAGKLAIQRGPLVFAAEAVDHGGSVDDIILTADAELSARFDAELLGGMTVVEGMAQRDGENVVPFRAIPYFAWANRGVGEMAVWLPTGR
jgi:DUF1680 family protein